MQENCEAAALLLQHGAAAHADAAGGLMMTTTIDVHSGNHLCHECLFAPCSLIPYMWYPNAAGVWSVLGLCAHHGHDELLQKQLLPALSVEVKQHGVVGTVMHG